MSSAIPAGLHIFPKQYPLKCDTKTPNGCNQCQTCILKTIDSHTWDTSISRWTQHYGYRYDYASKTVSAPTTPLSDNPAIHEMVKRWNDIFKKHGGLSPNGEGSVNYDSSVNCKGIEQCIVNNYKPKEKIGKHIDLVKFGPVVMTVSLGSTMTMKMINSKTNDVWSCELEGGDVVMLTGDARYVWTHELLPRSAKNFRRVSVTFRSMA